MIRPFRAPDALPIYTLNRNCHKYAQPNIELLAVIKNGETWVAELDGKVVGFLISRITQVGLGGQGRVNIYNVAVDEQFRGKGIATELFKACHDFYKGQEYIYLHVDVNNPAQKLYFDLGYRASEIKRDFYNEGEHALVMWKSLR